MDLSLGRPAPVARTLCLDDRGSATAAEVARLGRELARCPTPILAVARRPVAPVLEPLMDLATCTLVSDEAARRHRADRRVVVVPDAEIACRQLLEGIERSPRAATALDQLLRQTAVLETGAGLAAEAAVYSMLLGGPEFTDWLGRRESARSRPVNAPEIALHREDDTLRIRLDRPRQRNALSFRMREALYEALELAVLDDTVRRVAITGAGPAFCSGGDLAEFGTAQDLVAAYLVRIARAPWRLIDELADRTHVHIHGPCIGAGLEMPAFAAHVTAAPETTLRLPELSMGLVPGAGGTVSVTRRIGRWRTSWLVLSGADLTARVALDWGLIDDIADRPDG